MAQQQALAQVAQAALPLAFQEYGQERGRQLGLATQLPTLLQTGQQLEAIQRQQQLAPSQALQQYAGLVSPIASGFPTTAGQHNTQANPFTTALRWCISRWTIWWCSWCNYWWNWWIIRRSIIMDKINKIIYDIQTKIKNKPSTHIFVLYILVAIAIIL
jgi:hypothetical protein